MILRKLAIVALGAAALTSCKEGGDSMEGAALTTNWDSLSYSIGISVGNGLKGQQLSDVSPKVIAQGINDVLDSTALIDDDEANAIIGAFMDKKRNEKSAKATSVSEGFLEENAKNPDVVTTGSGLQYIVIQEGTGDKPSSTDKVKVHYHGTLVNGNVFDSSVDRGEPVEFPVNGVIPGWVEGLQLMSVGSKYKFFIPSELAYGERGAGQMIGPGETLIFEVELLGITKGE
ncbi:MAG: FKBP-type peptidyl-prolyl cis-trans isomerase FklB [Salibacteraceae bacterium]|jgi:FKBP-type peptidyl-prolyl cis-trans isomerase FklB|tara:strand:- start:859 stop:1551 length:693 start_codon:yes stop_codon:yes gene_type:complete